jgi:hypothetical protein
MPDFFTKNDMGYGTIESWAEGMGQPPEIYFVSASITIASNQATSVRLARRSTEGV